MVQVPDGKIILSYRYRLNHSHNPQTNLYEFDSFDVTDSLFYFQYSTSLRTNFEQYQGALMQEFRRQQDAFEANDGAGISARIESPDSSNYRFIISSFPVNHTGKEEVKPIETIYRVETAEALFEDTPNYMITIYLGSA